MSLSRGICEQRSRAQFIHYVTTHFLKTNAKCNVLAVACRRVCHCSLAAHQWTVLTLLVPFSDARAQHGPDGEEHGPSGAGVAAAGRVQPPGLPLLALADAGCRLRHVHGCVPPPACHVLACSIRAARAFAQRSSMSAAVFNCVLWAASCCL